MPEAENRFPATLSQYVNREELTPLLGRLLGAELVNDRVLVGLPRPEHDRGEFGLIRGIREMLGLQAEAVAIVIDLSAFAHIGPVEEIAGIELEPRFGREDLHRATALWLMDFRDNRELHTWIF